MYVCPFTPSLAYCLTDTQDFSREIEHCWTGYLLLITGHVLYSYIFLSGQHSNDLCLELIITPMVMTIFPLSY